MDKTHKWEFGMYPISDSMSKRYSKATKNIAKFIKNSSVNDKLNEDLSEFKGMLSRTVKKNQLDWFTVYEKLHYPDERELLGVISLINELRDLIKNKEPLNGFIEKQSLFLKYMEKLILNYAQEINNSYEYLYILSLKNEPDILKIGMTTGLVSKRVNQINSSTGVLNPYGVRKVFRVKNSRIAERDSHSILSDYRIRRDREFFKIEFKSAINFIEKSLNQSGQKIRNIGKIIYFNPASNNGKIKYYNNINIAFGEDDLIFNNENLKIGDLVEFDLNIPKKSALRVIKKYCVQHRI